MLQNIKISCTTPVPPLRCSWLQQWCAHIPTWHVWSMESLPPTMHCILLYLSNKYVWPIVHGKDCWWRLCHIVYIGFQIWGGGGLISWAPHLIIILMWQRGLGATATSASPPIATHSCWGKMGSKFQPQQKGYCLLLLAIIFRDNSFQNVAISDHPRSLSWHPQQKAAKGMA